VLGNYRAPGTQPARIRRAGLNCAAPMALSASAARIGERRANREPPENGDQGLAFPGKARSDLMFGGRGDGEICSEEYRQECVCATEARERRRFFS